MLCENVGLETASAETSCAEVWMSGCIIEFIRSQKVRETQVVYWKELHKQPTNTYYP